MRASDEGRCWTAEGEERLETYDPETAVDHADAFQPSESRRGFARRKKLQDETIRSIDRFDAEDRLSRDQLYRR